MIQENLNGRVKNAVKGYEALMETENEEKINNNGKIIVQEIQNINVKSLLLQQFNDLFTCISYCNIKLLNQNYMFFEIGIILHQW